MSKIRFEATPYMINSWTILRLPKEASAKLPSRGLAMVKGTMNGAHFQSTLEPDGMGSHWFRIDDALLKSTTAYTDGPVTLEIESTKEWVEPDVPTDIANALATDAKARNIWTSITPMARWEWIRWIRATNRQETRQRRIEVACSKMRSGSRRPCCFNASMCTEPAVSKNGVLLEPAHAVK